MSRFAWADSDCGKRNSSQGQISLTLKSSRLHCFNIFQKRTRNNALTPTIENNLS